MSQWTHINASIRFDGIPGLTPLPDEKVLGRIVKYDSADYTTFLPCGSEGSIEYKIIVSGSPSSLACRVVCFYGDLRDYTDAEAILKYFQEIVKDKMVRSGVLEINIEYQETLIYTYSNDSWVLVSNIKNNNN